MKFTNPWDPQDSDRLLWQAITLVIDAALSLRVVRSILAINPFAEAEVAAPKRKRS
jgi:hypothetical protein